MNNSTFFSIILPTYNRASLLGNAIRSVLSQTYTDWELIILDDGSNDNTREVVGNFGDLRIQYIYQENAERSAARNRGINHSSGKFISFLDSDDLYQPNHLQSVYDVIIKHSSPTCIFISDVIRVQNNEWFTVPHEDANFYPNSICYILLAKESVIPARVTIHSEILKSELFNETLTISEDAELFCRILARWPLVQINSATVVYKIHEDNTTNINKNPFAGQLNSLRIIFKNRRVRKYIPRWVMNRKYSTCYFGIAKYHLWAGHSFSAIYYLIVSIYFKPFDGSSREKLYLILSQFRQLISPK